mgnify:CR=1 FL=1
MKKLVVVGGGAAGFFCAVNAARMNAGLQVILLEKSAKLLSKVRISGGGRCNTTHELFDIPALVKKYPRGEQFVKKAFHQFGTKDTINWFEARGVKLHAEADGRMFPVTNQSATIIDCLLREADLYKVKVCMNTGVQAIDQYNDQWKIHTEKKEEIIADAVCVACGGLPKLSMFSWLQNTGHHIVPPVPSLFTLNMPKHPITALMGVSVPNVSLKVIGSKLKESGPLLITHWGLSGPAVLKLSAWGARQLAELNYHFEVAVNWLGEINETALREEWSFYREQMATQKMSNKSPFALPNRLWQFLLLEAGIGADTKWAELKSVHQNKLIQLLTHSIYAISGKTTFKEEFVTAGGISLSEIHPQTMESRIAPNLYFAGEVMDVDGITGGFNFQHAWTSGFIAANAIAQKFA